MSPEAGSSATSGERDAHRASLARAQRRPLRAPPAASAAASSSAARSTAARARPAVASRAALEVARPAIDTRLVFHLRLLPPPAPSGRRRECPPRSRPPPSPPSRAAAAARPPRSPAVRRAPPSPTPSDARASRRPPGGLARGAFARAALFGLHLERQLCLEREPPPLSTRGRTPPPPPSPPRALLRRRMRRRGVRRRGRAAPPLVPRSTRWAARAAASWSLLALGCVTRRSAPPRASRAAPPSPSPSPSPRPRSRSAFIFIRPPPPPPSRAPPRPPSPPSSPSPSRFSFSTFSACSARAPPSSSRFAAISVCSDPARPPSRTMLSRATSIAPAPRLERRVKVRLRLPLRSVVGFAHATRVASAAASSQRESPSITSSFSPGLAVGEEQIGDVHLDEHALPLPLLLGALALGLRRRRPAASSCTPKRPRARVLAIWPRIRLSSASAPVSRRLRSSASAATSASNRASAGGGRRRVDRHLVAMCLSSSVRPARRAVGAVRLGLRRLERREERVDALEQPRTASG